MPTYQLPGSDIAKLDTLQATIGAAEADIGSGKNFIPEELFNTIKSFTPGFEEKVTTVSQLLSKRTKEIKERNNTFNKLSTYTRDAFEVARRQVNRLDLPAHTLQSYGLPLDGRTPKPSSETEWITIAKNLIAGAKEIEAKGLPVVQCPSPEEIAKVCEEAEKERKDVSTVDLNYDEAQEGIADMRAEAEELISDVMAELRHNLRKKDTPSQRRIMRRYGARYKYLPGESVDSDDSDPIVEEAANN